MGGFMALDYAARFGGEFDGLCLLAPYLGNRMLTAEIAAAPGLDAWEPGELAEADAERRIWRYIKTRVAGSPPLYLGFGQDDRFVAAHQLLAAALPPASVDVIAGGHEWRTWTSLWENFSGIAIFMNQQDALRGRWVPAPLLYASATLHLGAAGVLLARPAAWPWALGTVLANHMVLAACRPMAAQPAAGAELEPPAGAGGDGRRCRHHHR